MRAQEQRDHSSETSALAVTGGRVLGATIMGLGSIILTVALILAIVAGAMLAVFGPAAPLVTVPDVVGMNSEEAEAALQEAHLTMRVVNYEYDPNVKEGAVIAVSPYARKRVRAGREVRVSISRGGRTVKMPKLEGLTLAEATDRLTAKDLQLGEEQRQASDEPADIVLQQDPPHGTVLRRKTKINLLVSGGKDFGAYDLGDRKFIFRTLKIIVPQGKVLQIVQVDVAGEGMEKSFLERLCRPGEVVKVDLYGPEGARVRVKIEDERVFSGRL